MLIQGTLTVIKTVYIQTLVGIWVIFMMHVYEISWKKFKSNGIKYMLDTHNYVSDRSKNLLFMQKVLNFKKIFVNQDYKGRNHYSESFIGSFPIHAPFLSVFISVNVPKLTCPTSLLSIALSIISVQPLNVA